MSNSKRRHFTPEQKAEIVRRHVSGKEPVSKLAEELDVQPSQIHTWVNQVLSQAERAFESSQRNGRSRADKTKDRRIEQLEAKIAGKNEVIAELMEANVRAKKELGEL
jgi:transposase-like protein